MSAKTVKAVIESVVIKHGVRRFGVGSGPSAAA
jgi:hypothetical protein